MSFQVDPSLITVDTNGQVKIANQSVRQAVSGADGALLVLANTGCNNVDDCSNSENEGHCVNSGTC